jgi:RNA polymerase sigma-B factor
MLKKDTALPLEEAPNEPIPALTKEAAASHSDALFAEFYRTRAAALREQLVELHMNLVRFLARKYANRGEPLEDLIQVGSIGLLNAIDRFDPTRGIRFATFATPTILGEIRRYFRDRGWAVKVPRRLQEVNLAATRAADSLTQTLGRAPTFAEIAQAIGSTEEETIEALEISSFYEPISLESEFDDGMESASVLGDYVGEEDSRIEALDLQERLQDALSRLAPRERAIVEMRFLRSLSQMEVAKRLKISQMHVSRLQQRALTKLRQIVKEL